MRNLLWAIIVPSIVCAWPAAAPGVHLPPPAEQGEALFQKRCSVCHTVGGGRAAGPDLAGVTVRRDRAWLIRMITAPGALLDSGDPDARRLLEEFRGIRMPDRNVSPEEADAILAYLAAGSASAAAAAQAPPAPVEGMPAEEGDPETGKLLFSGTIRFRNGGAACAACHAIDGLPGGGGTLGPDLTQTYNDYGEEAIAPVLADLPFPSMKPIYDARPLTPEEQGHIIAFLRVSAEREAPGERRGLLPFGIAGGLLGIGLAHVVWRKRLAEVRRPLLRGKAGREGGGA